MKSSLVFAQIVKPRLAVAGSGLAAGLISSLAVSALVLLVEKVAGLPVGTFYAVLAYAVLQTQVLPIDLIAIGFVMHLATGSFLGLLISGPFCAFPRWLSSAGGYAPVYGLAAGFAVWLVLFLPVTFWVMLPLLSSLESRLISQEVPTGEVSSIATGELLALTDKVIAFSLVFNVFYGLLSMMLTRSIFDARKPSNQVII